MPDNRTLLQQQYEELLRQAAAKDHEIAELQSQAALLRAGLKSAHASGILEAAKKLRESAGIERQHDRTSYANMLDHEARRLESLARQHPQPTAGQEVEVQRNTAEELYAMAQREAVALRATVARLETELADLAYLKQYYKDGQFMVVDALGERTAQRDVAQRRIATLERELAESRQRTAELTCRLQCAVDVDAPGNEDLKP
ncbi:MAG TPA: hypothetical protein VHO25_22050 [Polyangiaceae bacterium]|nr:hypothetical protein [Polyangiaceae bacterium]